MRQAFEEAIHTHAYQYIVESLGLDEARSSTPTTRSRPSATGRIPDPFIDTIMDPASTGTPDNDQKLLKSLIVFACLMEGLFFYVGFTQIPCPGPSEQDDRRRRAVPVHPARRVHALQLRHRPDQPDQAGEPAPVDSRISRKRSRPCSRRPSIWNTDTPRHHAPGVLGMNASMFKASYLRYIANRRAQQIGLEALFPNEENPFPWMSEMIDLKKERNFRNPRDRVPIGGALSRLTQRHATHHAPHTTAPPQAVLRSVTAFMEMGGSPTPWIASGLAQT